MGEEKYFEKNVFVHERNEKEEVLPIDIEITIKGIVGKVKVVPMTKGQIDEMRNQALTNKELMNADKDKAKKQQQVQDKEMILKHIVEPKFEDKDFKFFKPKEYVELTKAIMIASGFEKEEIDKMFTQLVNASLKEIGDIPPK